MSTHNTHHAEKGTHMPLDTNRVRERMNAIHLSQRELAMMSGVTEAAMSRYLAGTRQPKADTLANMATALHTTSRDLLGMQAVEDPNDMVRLVARNVDAIPPAVRRKLIQLLSKELPMKKSGKERG